MHQSRKGCRGNQGCPEERGGGTGFVTPTEMNVHGDALCFMVKTWARHKTTETVLNNRWWLAALGGWRSVAVDS